MYNGIQFDRSVWIILSSIQIFFKKKRIYRAHHFPLQKNNVHLRISSPNKVQIHPLVYYTRNQHIFCYIVYIFSSKVLTRRIDSSLQIRTPPLRERPPYRVTYTKAGSLSSVWWMSFGTECLSNPLHHASILP